MKPGRPRARAQDNGWGSGIELPILMDRLSVLPRQCRAYKEPFPAAKHTCTQETRRLFSTEYKDFDNSSMCEHLRVNILCGHDRLENHNLRQPPKAAGAAAVREESVNERLGNFLLLRVTFSPVRRCEGNSDRNCSRSSPVSS